MLEVHDCSPLFQFLSQRRQAALDHGRRHIHSNIMHFTTSGEGGRNSYIARINGTSNYCPRPSEAKPPSQTPVMASQMTTCAVYAELVAGHQIGDRGAALPCHLDDDRAPISMN